MSTDIQRNARLMSILRFINERGSVEIAELRRFAEQQGWAVSDVTLRQDLGLLESLLPVRRSRRGRYEASESPPLEQAFSGTLFGKRLRQRPDAKRAIAEAAVQSLAEDCPHALLLDAGSSTYFVAQEMADRHLALDLPDRVYTTSVPAALMLGREPGITTWLLPGEFSGETFAVSGDLVVGLLRGMVAAPEAGPMRDALVVGLPAVPNTEAVIAANLVSAEALFTDNSLERTEKRAMISVADSVTILADASKVLTQHGLGLVPHEIAAFRELRPKTRVRLISDVALGAERTAGVLQALRCALGDGFEVAASTPGDPETGAVVIEARRTGAQAPIPRP